MISECLACGADIKAPPSRNRKYCNRVCSMGQQRPTKPAFEWLFNKVEYEARKGGRSFTLTFDQFLEFTKTTRCHYCEATILWMPHAPKNGRCYYLDRKNNDIGYEKHNCVVCCSRCNRAKSNQFTYAEWVLIGRTIQTFAKKRR